MLKTTRRDLLTAGGSLAMAAALAGAPPARAATKVLKIGHIGVMSGSEASWGLVSKYSALAVAELYNAKGGIAIGGETYTIAIVSVDDRDDPRLTVSGGEKLTASEGIRYIIGPNTDATATSLRPVVEKNGAMYFPYSWVKALYSPPSENAVLSNTMGYQTGPVIFKYLKDNRGVKKVGFVTPNLSENLAERDVGIGAAKALGLEVVSGDDTYEANATDFFSVMTNVVGKRPDLIVLEGVAPANCPQLIRAARELGFKGFFASDTAQDIKILNEGAGDYANGLVSMGGASTPDIASPYMKDFMASYTKIAGEWNDEAGTKAYALEIILQTLKIAGKSAIDDIAVFKKTIPTFAVRNPFLKDEKMLTYVGESDFGQKRQIGVPLVITEVQGGAFKPVFVGQLS